MRSILILATVLSLNLGVEANHINKATIVFKSPGNFPIEVILDGRRQHHSPKKTARFEHVRPGNHHVRIYRIRSHGYWGSVHRELIYSGSVHPRMGFHTTYGLYHRHLRLISQRPIRPQGYGNGQGYGHHNGHGHGSGHGQGYGNGPCNVHGTYNCGCSGYNSGNHPWYGPPVNNQGCYQGHCGGHCGGSCGYQSGQEHYYNYNDDYYGGGQGGYGHWKVIPNGFFESIINRSRNQFSDEKKVSFFLRELDNKQVTTAQVRRLADELFFEKEKYHLVTSLYLQTVDQAGYNNLSELFFFNNTREDFERYVHTQSKKEKNK